MVSNPEMGRSMTFKKLQILQNPLSSTHFMPNMVAQIEQNYSIDVNMSDINLMVRKITSKFTDMQMNQTKAINKKTFQWLKNHRSESNDTDYARPKRIQNNFANVWVEF